MKRTFRLVCSFLFMVMLIFGISILPASAAGAGKYDVIYSVEAKASTVDAGDWIELRISLTEKPGLKYAGGWIDYSDLPVTFVSSKDFPGYDISNSVFDSTALSITHNEADKIVSIDTGDLVTAIFKPDMALTYDATGLVAVIFFQVNDDFDGKITFTLESSSGYFYPYETFNFVGDDVTITSVCEGAHTHIPVVDEAVPPTCTETGLTEGSHCESCGEVLVAQEVKPMLHHDEIYHESKAPTCTEDGYTAHVTCSRCDYSTKKVDPKLGHASISVLAKAPSCTEVGWNAYEHCTRCDYTTYVELPALGHALTQHEAKAPDCENIGWDAYEDCERCDYTTYSEKKALGHDEIQHEAKTPTCDQPGCDAYVT